MDSGPRGNRACRDRAEQLGHTFQHPRRIDVSDHHQDGVVRGVPGIVEALEHAGGGLFEGLTGSQRIVGVDRPLEESRKELRVHHVLGIGEILGDLLFYGPPLLAPQLFGIQQAAHAQGFDVQSYLQILGGHREVILGYRLPGIGIEAPTHGGGYRGQLVRRQAGAAPEHHVLLRVRQARKSRRGLVGADQVVDHRGCDRSQAVGDDHDPQAVVQGGPEHARLRVRVFLCRNERRRQEKSRSENAGGGAEQSSSTGGLAVYAHRVPLP